MLKNLIFIRRALILAVVVFAFSVSAAAIPLSEYRENIEHLRDDLDLIIYPEEDSTDAENLQFEREVFEEFPELLPPRDKIEWENSTIEVDNRWIYAALDKYKNASAKSAERETILKEISERLSAIKINLDELETTSASNRNKDEDKRKLAEILRREEFQKPEEKPESFFQKVMRWIDEWLTKNLPSPRTGESGGGFQSLSFLLQMLIYALVLGGIGFLIYRFAPFLFGKYKNREKGDKNDRVILGERLAKDETSQSLFSEAEQLARQGDLRGAIRKGYIALLCELSDRKIIGLSQNKTNRDYLRDVRKQAELYKNIYGLTNNYERHWYGFDEARESDWEEFRQGYKQAVSSQ